MAGLYIHIPFCKQACHYCNFHFSTSLKYRKELLNALEQELNLQQSYLNGATLESIYLGGGTPSLLSAPELNRLFKKIASLFTISDAAEITLEANPDDISNHYLATLRDTPINRLSIGIQSFSDQDLKYMNRAHSAKEAEHCIDKALAAGFKKLTVDLIYGTPTMDASQWAYNIKRVLDYGVPHISCYCLTVEPQTPLAHFVKTGQSEAVDDTKASRQFLYLIEELSNNAYDHYEISNFGLPGHYAVHNSNYWLGKHYLGIGPSAHSFNGVSRQWTIANNALYIKALGGLQNRADISWYELEHLDEDQRYNEYVMTRLRTIWGVELSDLSKSQQAHFLKEIQTYCQTGHVLNKGDKYYLSEAGRLLADRIAMEVFR